MIGGLRYDRLLSVALFSLRRDLAGNQHRSIPVLMYHSIGMEDEAEVRPYYRQVTSPTVFRSHMEYLHRHGFEACSLIEALAVLESSTTTASWQVVITFDDGYRDFHQEAFPVLQELGFSATVFLPTSFIGSTPRQLNGRECLTWQNVRELQREGISFGSHTVSHPRLQGLSRDAIHKEITDSKKAIEDKTGTAVHSFAYPYAFPQTDVAFRRMLRTMLKEAGYTSGVCTAVGRVDGHSDPYFLARLPINDGDDEALFRAKLAGAYDWVGHCQSVFKWTRSLLPAWIGQQYCRWSVPGSCDGKRAASQSHV